MGESVKGGLHYRALFAIGLVLFAITFIINFIADLFLNKKQEIMNLNLTPKFISETGVFSFIFSHDIRYSSGYNNYFKT
jgi:hypothetical protein